MKKRHCGERSRKKLRGEAGFGGRGEISGKRGDTRKWMNGSEMAGNGVIVVVVEKIKFGRGKKILIGRKGRKYRRM